MYRPTYMTIIAGEGHTLGSSFMEALRGHLRELEFLILSEKIKWDGRVFDITLEGSHLALTHSLLKPALQDYPIDCLIMQEDKRKKRFLIADMESTMIQEEMLDELADQLGLKEFVASITARAMNGELDFATALKERAALLKGMTLTQVDALKSRITFMPGAAELLRGMKEKGALSWLVSGGFTIYAEYVAEGLSFDRFFANQLVVEDGVLLGTVKEPILDKEEKRRLLLKGCADQSLSLADSLAIGDGANDLPMLLNCHEAGGLAIAYRAKPSVKSLIPNQINYSDHRALLFAQDLL